MLLYFHREPDFSAVHPGVRILVKCDDNLWHRAVVLTSSTTSVSKSKCEVKLESSGKMIEVDLHCILPLGMFDILPSSVRILPCFFVKLKFLLQKCTCRIRLVSRLTAG
jgi:hypothetical protein